LRIYPERVHVTIPLVQHPATKIVTVSPSIVDQPLPPYLLGSIAVTPNQVRVTGRPERVDGIETLPTEDISVRTLTSSEKVPAQLVLPPNVAASTLDGKPIGAVTVSIVLRRLPAAGPAAGGSAPGSPHAP